MLILLAGALVFAGVLGRIIFSVAARSNREQSNLRRSRRAIWPAAAFDASGHRDRGFASPYIRLAAEGARAADARAAQISDEIEDLLMRVVRRRR